MRPKKKDEQPHRFERPPTFEDEWAAKTEEQCALAMVRWLKNSLNTKRQICSINITEMRALASAATHEWIVQASRRPLLKPETDDDHKLKALLY